MKKPFFSVVVTAYNCEKYIIETLKSIQSQTFEDYEVVIIEDASSDGTAGMIADFVKGRNGWAMYHNDVNMGVAMSRNRGFEIVQGRYIAILDGDDVWYPDKLTRQYHVLKNEDVQLCYTSYSFIDEKSNRYGKVYKVKPKATYNMLLRENFIGCSTAVFDANIVKKYSMNPDVMHEDYLFWLTMLKNGYVAKGILEPMMAYRIHPEGRSFGKAKASGSRFDIYYRIEKLGLIKSVYYFGWYIWRAVIKYMRLQARKSRR